MKQIILVVSILIFASACTSKNDIPKPTKPIDETTMENILYDLAILQALKSYSPEKLTSNSINAKTYIYKKYKIDSLQFVENNKYFASDTENYKKIFENVANRLTAEKKLVDTIIKKEDRIKSKKIRDSFVKMEKKGKKIKKMNKKLLIQG